MTKKIFVLLIASFSMVSCIESTNRKISEEKHLSEISNDTARIVDDLIKYYEKVVKEPDNDKFKKLYLSAFPSNFSMFHTIYGYTDKDGSGILYEKYEKHIDLFCNLSDIDKEEYAIKLIKLGIDGYWEADAVGKLQQCMLKFTNENIDLIAEHLAGLDDKSILSFWYFLFDGPHPEKEIPLNVGAAQSSYPRVFKLAKDALKNIRAESDKHGH